MSSVFSCDAAVAPGDVACPNGVLTPIVATRALTPPFGNCKAKVLVNIQALPAADNTSVNVQINRNPAGENRSIDAWPQDFAAGASDQFMLTCATIDEIPDGRDVVYQVLVKFTGGVGDGVASGPAYIEVTLLSG